MFLDISRFLKESLNYKDLRFNVPTGRFRRTKAAFPAMTSATASANARSSGSMRPAPDGVRPASEAAVARSWRETWRSMASVNNR